MEKIDLTSSHSDFSGIRWVLKACGGQYPVTQKLLFSEEGKVVATDGHRLHVYTLQELEAESGCLWEIVQNKATRVVLVKSELDSAEFPDWKHVIPEGEPKAVVPLEEISRGNTPIEYDKAYTNVVRALPKKLSLQYRYFCDVLSCQEPLQARVFRDMVEFKGEGGYYALVMTFSME